MIDIYLECISLKKPFILNRVQRTTSELQFEWSLKDTTVVISFLENLTRHHSFLITTWKALAFQPLFRIYTFFFADILTY